MTRFAALFILFTLTILSAHADDIQVFQRGRRVTLTGEVLSTDLHSLKIESDGRTVQINLDPLTHATEAAENYKIGASVTVEGEVTEVVDIPQIRAFSLKHADAVKGDITDIAEATNSGDAAQPGSFSDSLSSIAEDPYADGKTKTRRPPRQKPEDEKSSLIDRAKEIARAFND